MATNAADVPLAVFIVLRPPLVQAKAAPEQLAGHLASLLAVAESRKEIASSLPAPLAPLSEVRPLGAEGRVVAVAGVEPGVVGEAVEDL